MSDVRVWLNGKMVESEEARLPHLTHTFHYGLGAFEGIRAYQQHQSGYGAVFRLGDHINRLLASCHLVTLDQGLTYDVPTLSRACVDTLIANGLDEGYLRPVIYIADGAMGIGAKGNPIHAMVAAWKWGAYLGEEGLANGIRASISSFKRPGHASVMSKAKLTGQYINSILAKREAVSNGFDEAILLNEQGYITEATGENIFMVIEGELVTPPLSANILSGITRASIIEIARTRAAEVTPVREIDRRTIGRGARGPMTEELQQAFFDIVRGRNDDYAHWLTPFSLDALADGETRQARVALSV